ncbi:DUF1499 domain-containing protein [Microvirga sp. 17 mud 1-3]|uniref:DUF1499 domain-containing protein n=1 Tax=Microvirga sp. 17 mud 1-3 TaxID=2082949 RepID=UPI000D6D2124|nr:DUF1499 domain-containing protein [Microvirga sp. 17 mud 1-3]AWM86488.1 DUF1499 domain-containing protein [Microvirga sp. 17 mud 1-3]
MRHLIIEEPYSRPAKWSPAVAWFALAATAIAAGLVRFGWIDYQSGLVALAAGILVAVLAVALAFLAFIRIWQEGRRGLGYAVRGLIVAGLVLAYPAWMAMKAATLPPITDVSTDTEDPPTFSRSRAALDARGGRVPPDPSPEVREAQRSAYIRIAPLTLDIAPDQAFEVARKAAERLGWQIIEAVPPGGRMGTGRLEAVDRTFPLKLPEDVTVRIRPRVDGTRIDIRSASRLGSHDLGTNAARIRAFLDETANQALAID